MGEKHEREFQIGAPEDYQPGDVIVPREEIARRTKALATELAKEFKDKNVVLVTVLKGGAMFGADLARDLFDAGLTQLELEYMIVRSYDGTENAEKIELVQGLEVNRIAGKDVIIAEDVSDTGPTLVYVEEHALSTGAASITTAVLIDKPDRRTVPYKPVKVGFTVLGGTWVEGGGMDTKQRGRPNPHIIRGPFYGPPGPGYTEPHS